MNDLTIVVDEDIDPADWDDVLFALTTRCDPAADIDIIDGTPSSTLDTRIESARREAGDLTGSTMLIDACKPYHWREQFPERNIISDELRAEVAEKWDVAEWAGGV